VITTAIKPGMIVHTGRDDVSLPQITEAMQSWYRHPEFDPELPVLWDLRTIDLTLSRAQLPETDLSEWSSQMLPLTNAARAGRKTAWVFGSAAVAEFAVELLGASDWQHKVRIFNDDIEAAVSWLTSTIR
jgi:hypothetical protein